MKKITILTVLLSILASGALASESEASSTLSVKPEVAKNSIKTKTNHELMEEAIESNDYVAWHSAAVKAGIPAANKITTANFAEYVKMSKLEKKGKYQEAVAIRSKLGLLATKAPVGVTKYKGPKVAGIDYKAKKTKKVVKKKVTTKKKTTKK